MNTFFRDLWLAVPPVDFQSPCPDLKLKPSHRRAEIRALVSTALDENQLIRLAKTVQIAGTGGLPPD